MPPQFGARGLRLAQPSYVGPMRSARVAGGSHIPGRFARRLPGVKSVVTGGAGFIGSHLVDALAGRGDEVLVLDDFSSGKRENLTEALEAGVTATELDVADAEALFAAIDAFRPDSVFHLAAQIDVRRSMADPGFDARLNVRRHRERTRGGRPRRRLASSSSPPPAAPYMERAPSGATSSPSPRRRAVSRSPSTARASSPPRATSTSTRRTRDLSGDDRAPGQRLRPPAGPRDRGRRCRDLLRGRPGRRPAHVFGDGEQTRDYIHVSDVVAALLAMEGSEEQGPLNVGTGVETTVLELAERVGRSAGGTTSIPSSRPRATERSSGP